MDKIYRMATGCARCSGWQISHPLSLQASVRAIGCLIASFATRMTPVCNSAKIRILHFEIRNPEIITQDFGEPKFTD